MLFKNSKLGFSFLNITYLECQPYRLKGTFPNFGNEKKKTNKDCKKKNAVVKQRKETNSHNTGYESLPGSIVLCCVAAVYGVAKVMRRISPRQHWGP